MKVLALKSDNDDFLEKNINQLLKNIFEIQSIDNNIILEIALIYSEYIFERFVKIVPIEKRIENFKEFINKSNNPFITSTYLKVFDVSRSYNGKDYTSYTKSNQTLQKHWNEISIFLNQKSKIPLTNIL